MIHLQTFAIVLITFVVSACSSIGHEIALGLTSNHLKNTVGKQYSQVIYEYPAYGRLIGREQLDSGDLIMKHVGDFGTARSNFNNIYGKEIHQARVVYFLVDTKGDVKDWATEFYQAGAASCWVGICSGAKQEQVPSEELDKIVKTSSGASVAGWRAGRS
jgi:hypothetical protein